MGTPYSSVLLRWRPQFRQAEDGSYVQDYSAAFFMIERLIASSSSYVATDCEVFHDQDAWKLLPPILQRRVRRVKPGNARAIVSALMEPLFEEFEVLEDRGALRMRRVERPMTDITNSIAGIYFSLYDYVLACREKLCLDFPILSIRDSLDSLLMNTKNPRGRANLATISGVLSSYKSVQLDGLALRSEFSEDSATLLEELLSDELYRNLSSAAGLMAFPIKLQRACVLSGRLARRIAAAKAFKPVVNLLSKTITAATKIPLPDSEIGSLITREGFMPPIISLKEEMNHAASTYKRINPRTLAHPMLKRE